MRDLVAPSSNVHKLVVPKFAFYFPNRQKGGRLFSVLLTMNFPINHNNNPKQSVSRLSGLYVLTDQGMGGGHIAIAKAALIGGAKIIQLRDKSTSPRQILPIAHQIRRLTHQYNALFLINDQLDLAFLSGADGVHLGPDDFSITDARKLLGTDAIIGTSCGTPEEAIEAQKLGATYIGIGAVYGTQTKLDAGEAIGLDGLNAVRAVTTLPCAAIGGINESNFEEVTKTGVEMICVISAVANAGNEKQMEAAAKKMADF
jgi:thiamine-phosphate pyrophosphorylase